MGEWQRIGVRSCLPWVLKETDPGKPSPPSRRRLLRSLATASALGSLGRQGGAGGAMTRPRRLAGASTSREQQDSTAKGAA